MLLFYLTKIIDVTQIHYYIILSLSIQGPALRIPKPNQLLSASIKALSCPADLRTG